MATVKETNISGKEQVPKDSKSRTPTGEMRDHFGVAHTGIGYWGGSMRFVQLKREVQKKTAERNLNSHLGRKKTSGDES